MVGPSLQPTPRSWIYCLIKTCREFEYQTLERICWKRIGFHMRWCLKLYENLLFENIGVYSFLREWPLKLMQMKQKFYLQQRILVWCREVAWYTQANGLEQHRRWHGYGLLVLDPLWRVSDSLSHFGGSAKKRQQAQSAPLLRSPHCNALEPIKRPVHSGPKRLLTVRSYM